MPPYNSPPLSLSFLSGNLVIEVARANTHARGGTRQYQSLSFIPCVILLPLQLTLPPKLPPASITTHSSYSPRFSRPWPWVLVSFYPYTILKLCGCYCCYAFYFFSLYFIFFYFKLNLHLCLPITFYMTFMVII